MDAANPIFVAPDLGRGSFRIGAFPPDDHDIVVTLLAPHPASWEMAETVARQIGVALKGVNPEDPRPTILGGDPASLVVLPVPEAFEALDPGILYKVLTNFLHDSATEKLFAPVAQPRLWIAPFGAGPVAQPAVEVIAAIIAAFEPSARPAFVSDGLTLTISTPDLDDKDIAEILSRAESWVWSGNTGESVAAQTTTKSGPPPASDIPQSPEDPAAAATNDDTTISDTTINDAEFRFDRPVEGLAQDKLDRRAIAEAIAQKVIGVWKSYQTPPVGPLPDGWQKRYPRHPFIVHLAGRWGSGKSSILNFLAEILRADDSVTLDPPAGHIWPNGPKGWTIIEFNAWRQQQSGHAWWSLMTALASQAPAQMGPRGARFYARDRFWRFNSSWRNWIIGGAAALTLLLLWLAFTGDNQKPVEEVLKGIAAAITAIVGIVAFTGTFAARSQRTAEAIKNLEIDPTAALKKRFEEMIAEIHNPVAIFIDDLDRCDAAYVVELLQAMQTVYADVPVLYVVAADRDWLISAYDQVYKTFHADISKPGQPLGYLFVKKIFQLSVNVPDLSVIDQRRFLQSLLPDEKIDQPSPEEIATIQQDVARIDTVAGLTSYVASLQGDASKRIAGTAATPKLATEKATAEITHLLVTTLAPADDDPLLDANPRAITRLVNAYSFRLGYALRAGEVGIIGKLPYWCVLDLRFPFAARRLAEKPDLINNVPWAEEPEIFTDQDRMVPILAKLTQSDIEVLRAFG